MAASSWDWQRSKSSSLFAVPASSPRPADVIVMPGAPFRGRFTESPSHSENHSVRNLAASVHFPDPFAALAQTGISGSSTSPPRNSSSPRDPKRSSPSPSLSVETVLFLVWTSVSAARPGPMRWENRETVKASCRENRETGKASPSCRENRETGKASYLFLWHHAGKIGRLEQHLGDGGVEGRDGAGEQGRKTTQVGVGNGCSTG